MQFCAAGTVPDLPVTLGPYYYTISGAEGSLVGLPTDQAASAFKRALHSAIGLPDSYPLEDIHADLVPAQDGPSNIPAAHRHLLEQNSNSNSTAVWEIHLQSYTSSAPDLDKRMTAEYAASDLVFQLVLAGYVDPGSLAVVHAGFAPSLAHALEAVHDNSTTGEPYMACTGQFYMHQMGSLICNEHAPTAHQAAREAIMSSMRSQRITT